jgi:hypothetical protein
MGTQTESFELAKVNENADLCCQATGDAIAGDLPRVSCTTAMMARDGAPVNAVQCSLWANGPATVTVFAQGYDLPPQPLVSRSQENESCGVKTKEVFIDLTGSKDAGR